jgi:hypothetical protein
MLNSEKRRGVSDQAAITKETDAAMYKAYAHRTTVDFMVLES